MKTKSFLIGFRISIVINGHLIMSMVQLDYILAHTWAQLQWAVMGSQISAKLHNLGSTWWACLCFGSSQSPVDISLLMSKPNKMITNQPRWRWTLIMLLNEILPSPGHVLFISTMRKKKKKLKSIIKELVLTYSS